MLVRADQALDVGSEHFIKNLTSSMHTQRRRRWESTQFGKGWTEEDSLRWGLEESESGVWGKTFQAIKITGAKALGWEPGSVA